MMDWYQLTGPWSEREHLMKHFSEDGDFDQITPDQYSEHFLKTKQANDDKFTTSVVTAPPLPPPPHSTPLPDDSV